MRNLFFFAALFCASFFTVHAQNQQATMVKDIFQGDDGSGTLNSHEYQGDFYYVIPKAGKVEIWKTSNPGGVTSLQFQFANNSNLDKGFFYKNLYYLENRVFDFITKTEKNIASNYQTRSYFIMKDSLFGLGNLKTNNSECALYKVENEKYLPLKLLTEGNSSVNNFFQINKNIAYFRFREKNGKAEFWRTDGSKKGTFTLGRPKENPDDISNETLKFFSDTAYILLGDKFFYRSTSKDTSWNLVYSFPEYMETDFNSDGNFTTNTAVFFGGYFKSTENYFFDGISMKPIGLINQKRVRSISNKIGQNLVLMVEDRINLQDDAVLFNPTSKTFSKINTSEKSFSFVDKSYKIGQKLLYFSQNSNGLCDLLSYDTSSLIVQKIASTNKQYTNKQYNKQLILNNKLLFNWYDFANGEELWESDGTIVGTKLLKDINKGTASSFPRFTKKLSNFILLNAYDNNIEFENWKCDGSAEGTQLVANIQTSNKYEPSSSYYSNDIKILGSNQKKIFFSAFTKENGMELFTSDGSEKNTQILKEISEGTESTSFETNFTVENNDYLFFRAWAFSKSKLEYWFSDGTPENTQQIINSIDTTWNNILPLIGFQHYFYFGNTDKNKVFSIHCFDAKLKTFTLIYTLKEKELLTLHQAVNQNFYFATIFNNDKNLWKINPISLQMQLIATGFDFKNHALAQVNNQLYLYEGGILEKRRVYKIDPNSQKSEKILDTYPGFNTLSNSKYHYFINKNEVNRFDGVEIKKMPIQNLNPNDYFTASFILEDEKVISSEYNHTEKSYFVMVLDPISMQYKPINIGFKNVEFSRLKIKNHFFFFANENYNERTKELWISEGTTESTKKIMTIPKYENPFYLNHRLTAVGNTAFFVADDGVHGPELWKYETETTTLTKETVNNQAKLQVFPNPSSDILRFNILKNIDNDQTYEAVIFDNNGKKILQQKLQNNTNQLNISTLPQGIYFLNLIFDDGKLLNRKFVKM